jgi:hypothetical protein
MQANAYLSRSIARVRATTGRATAFDLKRLDREAESAYWLRFLNDRWLIYWHERLIGDIPAENAALALAFLRQKQSERAA